MLNVDAGAPDASSLDYRSELLPARQAMATSVWFGAPAAGVSIVPFAVALRRLFPAAVAAGEEAEIRHYATVLEARRRDRPLAAADVAAWLATLSPGDVARGRRALVSLLAGLRLATRSGTGAGNNPLLGFERRPQDLAAGLRRLTGRPSAATMLGGAIAQGMVNAYYLTDAEIPDPATVRSLLAPLFASDPPAALPNE